MACAVLLSGFLSPKCGSITIKHNYLRGCFGNTFHALNQALPAKLFELDIINSMHISEHIDPITKDLNNL